MSDSSSKPSNNNSGDDNDPPLPKGWLKTYSKSQKRYYYSHAETKHTQWHFPTASEVADPAKAKKRAQEAAQREQEKMKQKKRAAPSQQLQQQQQNKRARPMALLDATSVAIIVPYRDLHEKQQRAKHLKQFIPHMQQFLEKLYQDGRVSEYHVYIIEQSNDGRKFNRGKLLNIGFDFAKKQTQRAHDVFIFHDVDLLPQDDLQSAYATFPKTPYHIARVWDRYSNNPKYFGGVVSFSSSDFKRINGYPNTFWGWGGEDDEMQKRCEKLGIQWDYPTSGTLVDLEQMTLKEKLDFLRENKSWKCMVKWEALDEHDTTWKTNGLSDLSYKLLETTSLASKSTKVTVDVKLNGNHWANDKCSVDYMGDPNWKKKR